MFVENRLRHLVGTQPVVSTVLAPVPWFPSGAARFGEWARHARVPRREERHGLMIHHPRYPLLPKVGMLATPWLLYQAALRAVRRLMRGGLRFDVIDAHYLYPDGVAAVWLGRRLGVPVVLTARGSDVTQIAQMPGPGRMVSAAVRSAAAVITVSAALRDGVVALGAAPERVTVLRNGVDLHGFHPPADRAAARAALGLTRPALISVGHLIPRKGHDLTVRAMALLPEWELMVVGEGPERPALEALARTLGVQDRVRLLGARPHGQLAACYGAADLMVLASSREGWANVLLESMACGTPVVASDIPGNPEVVGCRDAGVIAPRSAEGIAAGVRDLWAAMPARAATRGYAEGFGWGETSAGGYGIYRAVFESHNQPGSVPLRLERRLQPVLDRGSS